MSEHYREYPECNSVTLGRYTSNHKGYRFEC